MAREVKWQIIPSSLLTVIWIVVFDKNAIAGICYGRETG
jgi:hypothetical protein